MLKQMADITGRKQNIVYGLWVYCSRVSLRIDIADHHSRFNLFSKLLLSISNKLIDRPSVFSGPAVIFFLPLCVG